MSSTAACAASMALFLISATLASRLFPPESSTTRLSKKRRRLLLAHALRLGFRDGFGDARLDSRLFERVIMRNRIGDQEAARADVALQADHAGEIVEPIAAMLELEAGRAGVEGRELVGVVADDRDPLGFQELERLADVEDRFGAGADDCNAGARQLDQIGRNVERLFGASVNAADAAGGEDFDAREPRDEHRRGDGRAGRALARGDQREIPSRGLDDAARKLAEPVDLLARKAHSQPALDDRDRRRNGAHLARRVLDGERRLDVARVGHAVGDDRRFERDDRLFGRARLGDLGGKIQ